jgi:CheY-like chemotaxis protein
MEQVLVNLVVNARDAMPDGGTISIRIDRRAVAPLEAEAKPDAAPGEYVVIAVSDAGVGMPPDVLERLFEPFFTTKDIGKGTGLGLSMVYGIVKQNGGFIDVRSAPNAGTTIEVCLPLVRETPDESVEGPTVAGEGGHETILLVEDEDMVRELTARMLERKGYRVLSASGGKEALDLRKRHRGSIDLLLTDVIMPVMNGRDLFDHIREIEPDLRVLFMSGYTDDVIARHGVLERGMAFLQKPFDYDVLLVKVREALAR